MLYKMEKRFFQNFDFHILLTVGFVTSLYGHTYFQQNVTYSPQSNYSGGQRQV